jgi:predicted Zn-dependent peptidase
LKIWVESANNSGVEDGKVAVRRPREVPLSEYFSHSFANGLQLLVEPVPDVRSAAFTLLTPAGVMWDPPGKSGLANVFSELCQRGAGPRDSRELATALDNLGVQRSSSAEIRHISLSAALIAENLEPAMALFADVLRRPALDDEQLDFCKASVLQEIQALEDEPSQKVFIALRKRAMPPPLGKPTLGEEKDVSSLNRKDAVEFHQRHFRPNGTILGVAGAVEFEQVRDLVGNLLGDWGKADDLDAKVGQPPHGKEHLPSDKIQTHIGLAFPSVSYGDPDFYNAHGVAQVLGGGMSSRLFTEVREKRGLCYSVSASYSPGKDLGVYIGYAGTTNERAAETLDVMRREFQRVAEGITANEVDRVRIGLKASLVMQEESTSARASVLARSWYNLGRVRTLEETLENIDTLTPESLHGFLERHPLKEAVLVTLGPKPLDEAA